MHLTSNITHSNGYAPYIAYYRSNGVDQLFRKLKPKPKLNQPNAHRSQIKICEKWHTHNVQFPFMPNAFRILKPIQKSLKRVWVFRNTGANAFAKNQMRLAYEDKRDLYCICKILDGFMLIWSILHNGFAWQPSTKYHILLCKKVAYNHILIWYWLSDCIGLDRDPTWRRNWNPDGGQSTAVGVPDTYFGRPAPQ